MVQDIKIEDFDYPLSEDKIAKFPLKQRDEAKLLVYDGKNIKDEKFYSLPSLINSNSLLIFNDTKVVYARLFFQKETGSKIEIFCLEPVQPEDFQVSFAKTDTVKWRCLIGNNKKWKSGIISRQEIINGNIITLKANRLEAEKDTFIVEFSWDKGLSFAEIMQSFGVIPLPPYLNREANKEDNSDYQTIYATFNGSVAAPTAGLHFTDITFQEIKNKGIETAFVTLHVGAGTFKPVTSTTIGLHQMHTEKITVQKQIIEKLLLHIGTTICVGTTSVRTIESLYWYGISLLENKMQYSEIDIKQWQPYQKHENISTKESLQAILEMMYHYKLNHVYGQTQLMIAPSYQYRIVNAMVTNFHQPKSTLLLLVSAMIGENWKNVYNHALENNYRFLSYGDACLFYKGI